ncbi:hypothetical protein BpHYR1_044505 [Brachionus plicatilis]|uniref:Uncharacterized protein n=1 Tax=Brachionus plicatilis TaxID=10195 RepID=A0A3M7SZ13_BRAPC|nr:hypothetical protein BpHYR1_044505 [Brachionus plicatilis]
MEERNGIENKISNYLSLNNNTIMINIMGIVKFNYKMNKNSTFFGFYYIAEEFLFIFYAVKK